MTAREAMEACLKDRGVIIDCCCNPEGTKLCLGCAIMNVHIQATNDERERCAKIAENMRLTGGFLAGETPGPLFDAGWDGCAAETSKFIRESN